MIALGEFDGIGGFRWAALLEPSGKVSFSEKAPNIQERGIALIEQVLAHAPFVLDTADLVFDIAKVLIRRGPFGLLLLFCDNNVNVSMVDIVLEESISQSNPSPTSRQPDPSTGGSGATVSMIQVPAGSAKQVPPEVIEALLDIYTEFLGPLARTLAGREAAAHKIPLEDTPQKDWPILLNLLAARISDETKREKFLDKAVLLKNRF